MNVIWIVLALAALGTGMGAAIASRFVSYRTDFTIVEIPDTNLDNSVAKFRNLPSFCQYNALNSVTASLYQVRAINAFAKIGRAHV